MAMQENQKITSSLNGATCKGDQVIIMFLHMFCTLHSTGCLEKKIEKREAAVMISAKCGDPIFFKKYQNAD